MTSARAFLLDLDGTLLDSVALDRRCFRHTFESHGLPVPSPERFLEGLGIPLPQVMAGFADDDAQAHSMTQTYFAYSAEHHDHHVRAYPGVLEMLRELVERGDRVAIVTSKSTPIARRGAEITGMTEFVEVLVGRNCVEVHKPDPHPFRHALSLLGMPDESAVVVGDSPHDLAAGRRGGFVTAAALWGPFPRARLAPERPDHWLTAPSDVTSI